MGATAQDTNTTPNTHTRTKPPHSHAVPNRLLSAPPYAKKEGGGGGGGVGSLGSGQFGDTKTKSVGGDCVVRGDGEASRVLSVHIYHERRAGSPQDDSLYDFLCCSVLQRCAVCCSVLHCAAVWFSAR